MVYGIPPGNPTVVWDIHGGVITNDPHVSWQYHEARTAPNPRGGVDMTASYVNLYAPVDCTIEQVPSNGGAGKTLRMHSAGGWVDVFQHLSDFLTIDGVDVSYGDPVAVSGETGAVSGPHLHWHREKNGVRYNPWDYFTDGPSTPEIEGMNMPVFVAKNVSPKTYAVLGASPGTDGNVMEFENTTTAAGFTSQIGAPVLLSAGAYDIWISKFSQPVRTLPPTP